MRAGVKIGVHVRQCEPRLPASHPPVCLALLSDSGLPSVVSGLDSEQRCRSEDTDYSCGNRCSSCRGGAGDMPWPETCGNVC